MADVFSREKRSEIMSRVRGRDNKATEFAMVAVLRHNRITGWRRHPRLFGKPDFIFSKQRVAVFVDGCFWHGCPKHSSRPATNQAFWKQKLARNKNRDKVVARTLKREGWRVLRIWQHEFAKGREQALVQRIQRALEVDDRLGGSSRNRATQTAS
ncbi:MAG TPA: very short patch repair endonuclease [Terriglobales bacterium]|nr:very short patch repair endonuclease [Terriglobales bacterium]